MGLTRSYSALVRGRPESLLENLAQTSKGSKSIIAKNTELGLSTLLGSFSPFMLFPFLLVVC
jgi:hypothetical protein